MKLVIEFTRPKEDKVLSRLIRWVQGTPYSHVRLRWVNSVGVDVVYEASGTQVQFRGPEAQKNIPVLVEEQFSFELDMPKYRELVRVCMTYAGLSYGIKQLLGIGLVRLLRLKENPFSRGRKSQVCSELVGRVLEEVLEYDTGLDLDIAGPKEIFEYLNKKRAATN